MSIGNTSTGVGLPLGLERYYNYGIKIHYRLEQDLRKTIRNAAFRVKIPTGWRRYVIVRKSC